MLKEYDGTILLVTHDKTFIENVATDLLIIRNHKIIEYNGNYSMYLKEEKEKTNQKQLANENDKLLLDFKLTQVNSELSVTKDEKRKKELEEEFNRLMQLSIQNQVDSHNKNL